MGLSARGGWLGGALVGAALAWLAALALALALGATPLGPQALWQALWRPEASGASTILWELRLPRALAASLVGASLAGAGCAWQAVLRNPLADPYLIGASAGGALGAGVAILFGLVAWWPPALPALAFGGSLGAVLLVLRLAQGADGQTRVERLILGGVALSAFLAASLSLLVVLKGEGLMPLHLWMAGGLSGRGWAELRLAWPSAWLGLGALWALARGLTYLQLGDELSAAWGASPQALRRWAIAAAALATASAVGLAGMVGFVGLLAPHAARLLVGPDLRRAYPVALFGGAALVCGADALARWAFAPLEVPVGVVLALLGAPAFLWLLRQGGRQGGEGA